MDQVGHDTGGRQVHRAVAPAAEGGVQAARVKHKKAVLLVLQGKVGMPEAEHVGMLLPGRGID